jgi:RyR domain
MNTADVARVCHEANRAYCQTLGDTSQVPWDEAPDWQRTSAENGVKFKIANPESTPENSHENWLREKETDGWKYGEVKDAEAKTHPCFVAYGDLPVEQRVKDAIFQGIVSAFLSEGLVG